MDANACLMFSDLVFVGNVSIALPGLVVWGFERTELRFSGVRARRATARLPCLG